MTPNFWAVDGRDDEVTATVVKMLRFGNDSCLDIGQDAKLMEINC